MPPYKSPSFCPTSFDLICMSKRKKAFFYLSDKFILDGRSRKRRRRRRRSLLWRG